VTTTQAVSSDLLQTPALLLIDCKTGYFSRFMRFGTHPVRTDSEMRIEQEGKQLLELGAPDARETLEIVRKEGA